MTTHVKPSGRDEVVEALLDAADRLFTTSGPADVSLRAIAREANVNHGMVHRHFGTRDDLVDRLLERQAVTWRERMQADPDFASAIQSILGDPEGAEASAGTWLRLLALSLLTDSASQSAESQRRYGTTLEILPRMLDQHEGTDAAVTAAAALALAFGWRFFHPYIRPALHLEDVDFADLQRAMGSAIQRLIESP